MPDADAVKHAMDKLRLIVSIDVRYSETGWFSDVILPESTYLERANILAQLPGPVPVFVMRDQAIAPRFDSRPAWWIFRELLRRMDKKEALDFETIEELWNYQLEGTGVTVADMRESGVVGLAAGPKLTPRDALKFPTPSGKIEIESDLLKRRACPASRRTSPRRRPRETSFTCCSGGHRPWRTASRSTIRSSTRSRPSNGSGSIPSAPSRWASATATRSKSAAVAPTSGGSRRG